LSLIDFTAAIGAALGASGLMLLLHELTSLPVWAVFLVAFPVGGLVGLLVGIGAGMLIAFSLPRDEGEED
jgi:hypothetical protein